MSFWDRRENIKNKPSVELRTSRVIEKIMEDNEQSLEAMLHDKRINPMKVLPSLNKKHGWNLPGVSREKANNTALPMSELLQLGANNGSFQQLEDNNNIVGSNTNS